MARIRLGQAEYRDKVFACWLGKNIGGTLGGPYECRKYVNCLTFYDPVPDGSAPNDDLDFQLIWLKMLEDRGIDPGLTDFADYWIKHLSAYPWNEYGFCRRNLERGLRPPVSGCFENYYVDEMGSPIRSEIWACIAPADPQRAAALAWKDSALDHAGGEGMYGERFWAAVESAAFVVGDTQTLIRIGLGMIPLHSEISRAVREAVWCHENGISWAEARERVVQYYGHTKPCNAPQNHAFTVIGWLYGKDFGDRLCKAVNCAYDTDCTGATLGSVLGIVGGTACIPEKWRKPVGEAIVLHKFTRNFEPPRDIAELTDRTAAIARRVVAERSDSVEFASDMSLPDNTMALLTRGDLAQEALHRDRHCAVADDADPEITFHYGGEPVMRPGLPRTVGVSARSNGVPVEPSVTIDLPDGWRAHPALDRFGQKRFTLFADAADDHNTVAVSVALPDGRSRTAQFVMLGPGEAKGYPSGEGVPTCPRCHARLEACICGDTG